MERPMDSTGWPIYEGVTVRVKHSEEIPGFNAKVLGFEGTTIRLRDRQARTRFALAGCCTVQQTSGKKSVPKPVTETATPYRNPFPADVAE